MPKVLIFKEVFIKMISHDRNIKIFTGNSNPELANEIAKILGIPMVPRGASFSSKGV